MYRYVFLLIQDGLCDRNTVPSVSSISRVLRARGRPDGGGEEASSGSEGDSRETRPSPDKHSIEGILGHTDHDVDVEEDEEEDVDAGEHVT